jgi:calcium-translocating P-type ATPase
MTLSGLSGAEALASLRSGEDGLSAAEAAKRLAEYGPNRIEGLAREPLITSFLRQFTHFFALILWLAAALAFYAERQQPSAGMATLGWAIVGVILVNGAFASWQEYRAERVLAALRRLLPAQARALRGGVLTQVPAEALVPGDLILLEEGDEVAADCRLIAADGVLANVATLTGESRAVEKDAHPGREADPLRARNLVLAGTALLAGQARAVVYATGMRTELGRIARLAQAVEVRPSPLQREISRLSRLVAVLAAALGLAFFLIGQRIGLGFWDNFIFAIGIIIANVPEGLLPTLTLSLAMATQRMAKRKALVRHLPAVETLGAATVILTDKTGTLTQNRMAVRRALVAEGEIDAAALAASRHRRFLEVARHCHDLREALVDGRTKVLGDPMEAALAEFGARSLAGTAAHPRTGEVAFTTDRRRLSTVHETAEGPVLYCKGALETVLPLCARVETAGGVIALTGDLREQFVEGEAALAERGMRVLAFAWRPLTSGTPRSRWEEALVLCGLLALEDPPRPEVPEAIRRCREAGIRVVMVTGDHPETARAIGREIGMVADAGTRIVTGAELSRLSPAQLQLLLEERELLFARLGADHKRAIVEAFQRKGEVVAVTGDGVNDAPALRQADIGVAMGLTGTEVAREAADLVLLDDNFASIVAAIEEGRAVFDNIRKFMTYILTSNIPEIVPYLAYALAAIPLPLTIIQILAVDLGTDLLPALALGAERPSPDAMQRPPRRRGERLLDRALIARAYLWLGPMEATAAMAAFFFVLAGAGWEYGQALDKRAPLYLQATAACLAAIVVTQIANILACRHPLQPLWHASLFDNRLIAWGVAVEVGLILAIVYTPLGNLVFGTAPLGLEAWLFMTPFALAMLALEEARKLAVRRRAARGQSGL